VEVDKWSNRGQYGFKIKISVKKQKSLTDRRIRGPSKVKLSSVQPENVSDAAGPASVIVPPAHFLTAAPPATSTTNTVITVHDINSFKEMLKESLAMDITS